jgi:hypothetical protein
MPSQRIECSQVLHRLEVPHKATKIIYACMDELHDLVTVADCLAGALSSPSPLPAAAPAAVTVAASEEGWAKFD